MPARADRPDRGAAVSDFVMVVAVLVPLFLGVLQVGLVLHVRHSLTAAASEGARQAATLDGSAAAAEARTRAIVADTVGGRYARSVAATTTTREGVPVTEVTISAEVPALGLFGPSVSLDVEGHAVREVVP